MPEPLEAQAEPATAAPAPAPAPSKTVASKTFDELAETSQPSILVELIDFLRYNKKWWLIPILILLGLFGVLFVLAQSAAMPFIYTL